MVKEGHDSTVRPVLKTWEFDQDTGRRIFDEWVRALRMHARIDACVSLFWGWLHLLQPSLHP
tara:strand:- start:1534 stop:1719 length:186 start_codon:yes stop_codon:yes gene_type:complete